MSNVQATRTLTSRPAETLSERAKRLATSCAIRRRSHQIPPDSRADVVGVARTRRACSCSDVVDAQRARQPEACSATQASPTLANPRREDTGATPAGARLGLFSGGQPTLWQKAGVSNSGGFAPPSCTFDALVTPSPVFQ